MTQFPLSTAGELTTHYAEKVESAQAQIADMMQELSVMRLQIDTISEIGLLNQCFLIIERQKELHALENNLKYYRGFKPHEIPRTPF